MVSGLQTRDDTDDDHDAAAQAEDPAPWVHPSDHLVDGPPAKGDRTSPYEERIGRTALNGEQAREYGGEPQQDGQIGDMGDEDLAGATITEEPVEDRAQRGSALGHTSPAGLLGSEFIGGFGRQVGHAPESGVSPAGVTTTSQSPGSTNRAINPAVVRPLPSQA
jgi:hypothetical protein